MGPSPSHLFPYALLRAAAVSRWANSQSDVMLCAEPQARGCAGPTEYLDEGRSAHT